jgi:hypothetical protein
MIRFTATQRLTNHLRDTPYSTIEEVADDIGSTTVTIRFVTYELLRFRFTERSDCGSAATFTIAGGLHE